MTATYGNCAICRFRKNIPKSHYKKQYYPLFCMRHPPSPPEGPNEIWSEHVTVGNMDGCFDFEESESLWDMKGKPKDGI